MPDSTAGKPSNKSIAMLLALIAMVLMPVGAMLDGAAQWILLGLGVGVLFLCAHQIHLNNRAAGQR
ncbi:hypothetical protein F0L17_22470 [Streptomyces sp. TRM43335]|uniref:Uncharacterized protein n=1 Tax=Streptomyces taklimakanensis TaxID=2569853 RepID=A0A6G2BHR2_9ACTN|nr:hypothetical protein [Streptomyces taklimakanensis]MTE21827.1 hypothetical protein [Streptomyces taklimakanensis]